VYPRAASAATRESPVSCSFSVFDGPAEVTRRIVPGVLVVAGDEDVAAVCQVIDLAPAGDGTIVHLQMLPGTVEDYLALA
jgi:hypothetical protein